MDEYTEWETRVRLAMENARAIGDRMQQLYNDTASIDNLSPNIGRVSYELRRDAVKAINALRDCAQEVEHSDTTGAEELESTAISLEKSWNRLYHRTRVHSGLWLELETGEIGWEDYLD